MDLAMSPMAGMPSTNGMNPGMTQNMLNMGLGNGGSMNIPMGASMPQHQQHQISMQSGIQLPGAQQRSQQGLQQQQMVNQALQAQMRAMPELQALVAVRLPAYQAFSYLFKSV